jgi:hypothetical protein
MRALRRCSVAAKALLWFVIAGSLAACQPSFIDDAEHLTRQIVMDASGVEPTRYDRNGFSVFAEASGVTAEEMEQWLDRQPEFEREGSYGPESLLRSSFLVLSGGYEGCSVMIPREDDTKRAWEVSEGSSMVGSSCDRP